MIRFALAGVALLASAAAPAIAQNAAPVSATAAAIQPYDASALSAYAADAMARQDVPGLSVSVVRAGQPLMVKGFGTLKAGTNRRVDEHSLFNIGSASKAFTTALIAQLVDEKKMTWDDPVAKHLPDLKLPAYAPGVTLRDLASHRTGWGAASYNFIGLDRKGLLTRIQHLPQGAPIRSRLMYNNLGYSVLAEAAASASGKSWEQLLRDRLFAPLSMRDATLYGPELFKLPNLAAAHAKIGGTMQPIKPMALDSVAPAGGIYASAQDMASWMQLHLAKGMAGDKRLIAESSIGMMQHMHMPLPVSGIAKVWASTHFYGYALGWFVRDYRGVKVVEHGGNTAGKSAFVLLVPELDFGVSVMANADGTDVPTAVAYHALDLALGGDTKDVGEILLASGAVEKPATVTPKPAPLPLASYAGSYASPLYGAVRIKPESAGLAIDVHPGLQGKLISIGEHKFDVVWDDAFTEHVGIYSPVTFELDSSGRPSRLQIGMLSNPTPTFKRQ